MMRFLKNLQNTIRKEEFDMDNLHTSIFLGFAQISEGGQSKEIPLSIHPGAGSMRELGNVLVVGPPGSGKTSLIRNNLMTWGHSAVVVDLKGQLYAQTAKQREKFGAVRMLDVRNGLGHRYNPLKRIDRSQWRDLAHSFISMQTNDPFWLSCCIDMWLCLWSAAEHADKPHIPYGVELITTLGLGEAMQYLVRHHGDDKMTMKHLAAFAGRTPTLEWGASLDEKTSRLLESKWASVVNTATILDDPHLLNIFSGDDVDIEAMFYDDGICTVFIQADETKPELFAVFSKLVIKTIGDALIKEGDKDNLRRPIAFFLDEIGTTRINSTRQWLDTMRSRDLVLILFAQEFDHMSAKLGEKFDENSINSIHHLVLFKPVDPSGRIAQKIINLSGKQSIELENRSHSYQKNQKSTNISYSQHERNIIEQEHIENWPMNVAYCVLTANTTIKAITRIPRMQDESASYQCEAAEQLAPLSELDSLLEVHEIEILPEDEQISSATKALKKAKKTAEYDERTERLKEMQARLNLKAAE